jgi:threonine dehydrogenase-like Zn-dependent dehydrogenase
MKAVTWQSKRNISGEEVPDPVIKDPTDAIPMNTLVDKQIQIRMGQANVKNWIDDILPLLTDKDPLGVDSFATHHMSLDEAVHAYDIFQKKEDGAIKIVLHP